jgi:hypothetical protein
MLKSIEHRGALVAIWSGEPTLKDCDEAMQAARACAHHNGGKPIVVVSIFRADVWMPSDPVRSRMALHWPHLVALASTIQYVSLPAGFIAARLISMLVSLFALGQRGNTAVGVHRALVPMLQDVQKACPGYPVAELEKLIRETVNEV